MSKRTHYLYLNFNDSSHIYTNNTVWDFQIYLPHSLKLIGDWDCALVDITSDQDIDIPLYIFCDFCEDNYVNNKLLPVIRKTYVPEMFTNLYNCKITRDYLTSFRIYIKTLQLKTPSFDCKQLSCTLRIKQK